MQRYFKIVMALGLFCAFAIAPYKDSTAQTSRLPGFSVPRESGQSVPKVPLANMDSQMFSSYETAFLKLRNRMLSDTLLLQYQINLLKILIRRQSEIDNIASSFKSMNIKFNQPAPDKSICEKLPENLLCMLFYPEVFDIDVEQYTKPLPAPVVETTSAPANTPSSTAPSSPSAPQSQPASSPSPAPQPEEEEDAPVTTPFLWSDIQCAAGYCKAVLIDRRASGRQFTVKQGETLSDDSVVTEISYNGVAVSKEGERLDVMPAPADGVFDSLARNDEGNLDTGIGDLLSNSGIDTSGAGMGGNRAGSSAPAAASSNESASDGGSLFDDMPAPAQTDDEFTSDNVSTPEEEPTTLGPTGLF